MITRFKKYNSESVGKLNDVFQNIERFVVRVKRLRDESCFRYYIVFLSRNSHLHPLQCIVFNILSTIFQTIIKTSPHQFYNHQ